MSAEENTQIENINAMLIKMNDNEVSFVEGLVTGLTIQQETAEQK